MAAIYPNVEAANKWCKAVVAGKVPACKWVKLACQRHLDDLAKSKVRITPINLNQGLQKKDSFVQLLPHTKGEWALKDSKSP